MVNKIIKLMWQGSLTKHITLCSLRGLCFTKKSAFNVAGNLVIVVKFTFQKTHQRPRSRGITQALFHPLIWLASIKTKGFTSRKSFCRSGSQTLLLGGEKRRREILLCPLARELGEQTRKIKNIYICIFSPSSGGIKVLDSGFLNGGTQPRTQASSRYPSYQRRLGIENEIAENDWERDCVGLAFRVPQAKIFWTPDSRKEEVPRFRNSLTKGYMDNSIQIRWIPAIKECEGNI